MWNYWTNTCMCRKYFFITGSLAGLPRSGKLPVLNLLRPKSGFSPRRGTDSGQTWQRRRARGSAWLRKISPQSPQGGGNAAPKYQNFPLFGKESPSRATRVALGGDSLDRFRILCVFYTIKCRTSVVQIWFDSLYRLLSYCWETAHQSIRPIFSVHPLGKTMRWIEKMNDSFASSWWARRALSPCKVWGRSHYTRRL